MTLSLFVAFVSRFFHSSYDRESISEREGGRDKKLDRGRGKANKNSFYKRERERKIRSYFGQSEQEFLGFEREQENFV